MPSVLIVDRKSPRACRRRLGGLLTLGLGRWPCAGDSPIWNARHCDTSRVPNSRPQVRGRAWAPPVQVSGAYDRLGIWSTSPCTVWVGPCRGSEQRGRCRECAAEPRMACAHPACGQVLRGELCSRSGSGSGGRSHHAVAGKCGGPQGRENWMVLHCVRESVSNFRIG
jgi:hypothetical protein